MAMEEGELLHSCRKRNTSMHAGGISELWYEDGKLIVVFNSKDIPNGKATL